jgi:hypothetical protein
VASGRASTPFMVAFTGVCVVIPWVVGQGIMSGTSYNNEQLQAELLRKGRDSDALVMGKVNKERLAQFLGEIQRKENTEDRYKAALNGETLTGTPEARLRGGGGSSVHHPTPPQEPKGSSDVVASQRVVTAGNAGASTAASS